MKKPLQNEPPPTGRVWLALLLVFIVGLCPAQEEMSTENQSAKPKKREIPWGFAGGVFTGYGGFAGELKDTYTGFIPIGLSIDVYYKNFAFYVGLFAGYGKTKHDILYDTAIWKKGDLYQLNQADLSIGYVAYKGNDYNIAPFVGVSFLDFGAATEFILLPDDEPSYWDGLTFDKATFFTVGINCDLIGTREADLTRWFLRLKYAYNFSVAGINRHGTDGSMHSLTIGLNVSINAP